MELPEKSQDKLASVTKNLYQRQIRIIVTMIGSFLLILLMAWLFTPRHRFDPHETKALPIPPNEAQHIATVDPYANASWTTIKVKNGDSLTRIFRNQNLPVDQLHAILSMPESQGRLTQLKPGHVIKILQDEHQNILQIIYKPNRQTSIKITRNQKLFALNVEKLPVETRQVYRHGEIKASLFNAGLRANVPSKLIMQLVNMFQWDIDFAKDIQPGDHFSVIFEQQYVDGEPAETGNILAAEFSNRGKTYHAIRYEDPIKHTAGYFTETGLSLKRRFTRTPVKFTRISSYFKPKRWHPVLHRFRKHTGVDYAAPSGTPIKATSNGRITHIGRKGGYGNAIILDHGNGYTTLYGHMLKFAKNLKKNDRVQQGQVIGYVGMTGLATGPHLHYEFRIHNKHRDPLHVALPQGDPVPKQHQKHFFSLVHRLLNRLATYDQIELAVRSNNQDSEHG